MKKISIILSLLFILAVGSTAITSRLYAKNSNPNATGHLVYDPVDQVWRCLGSPIDCAF